MRRRDFMSISAASVTAASVDARAQQARRVYRIGSLHQSPLHAPHHAAFYDELRLLGFIQGQNLAVDREGYGLTLDQLSDHASGLANSSIDVMLCGGDVAIRAAQRATSAVPIVAVADDIVGAGFVRSMAKPDGNVTGVSILATELDGKRQEVLIEAVPGILRIAALADSATTTAEKTKMLQQQASKQRVELSIHWAAHVAEIARAVDAANQAKAQAINVLATPLLFNNRQIIMERVAALRLPAMYQWPETAEEGGLIAYGPRFTQVYRQVARLIAKIFGGARPAGLPVEQPTRFELVINLKTARALGLAVPPSLLALADGVIE
jgi:ABC-type uncharacterized transport system substrate-binding protein